MKPVKTFEKFKKDKLIIPEWSGYEKMFYIIKVDCIKDKLILAIQKLKLHYKDGRELQFNDEYTGTRQIIDNINNRYYCLLVVDQYRFYLRHIDFESTLKKDGFKYGGEVDISDKELEFYQKSKKYNL